MRRTALALVLASVLPCGVVAAQDGGARYIVDASRSDVHWLVYKAGAFARRGHNHTVAVGDLAGSVVVDAADLAKSRFDLEFAVAELVVDDPALRSTLGPEFASVPTAEDIAGTRTNMLSERVLDGDQYPQIRITGSGPAAAGGAQALAVRVQLLGRTVDLEVPTEVTLQGDVLHAHGEFELDHADLGMQPFSLMMGALQVGEKLTFSYDVTARRAAR